MPVQLNQSGGGGGGTTLTGTGIARNSGACTELSGDVTTSGTNAATVVKVNGASVPASAAVVGTNSSSQVIAVASQTANNVFAGPTSGVPAAPAFRTLVAADIPNIAESQVTNLTTDLAAKQATLTGTGLARNTGASTELSGDVSTSGSNVVTVKTSLALPGSPTTTTQSAADNSTKIATTAYTDAAVSAGPTTFEGAACGAFITPWGTGIYPNETTMSTLVTGTTAQVCLIQVTAPITIRKACFYVQTGQTSANYYSAVYTFAGSLVANSQAKFTATGTGQQNVTFGTPFTLAPGMYYYYFCGDTALLAVASISVGSNITTVMLNTNIVRRGTAANGISGAAVPGTLGALTGTNSGRNLMMMEA